MTLAVLRATGAGVARPTIAVIRMGENTVEATRQAAIAKAAADSITGAGVSDHIYSTKADANSALGSVANGDYVQVLVDESLGNAWTIYQKVAGVYVYVTTSSSGGTATSTGAAQAGLVPKLDAGGRLDPSLIAPDKRATQGRYVLSESGTFKPSDPTFAGTMFDSRFQIYGTSQTDTGVQTVIFDNHSKGIRYVFGKSRGAQDAYSPCLSGDRILSFDFQAVGTGSQFGHAAQWLVSVDGTPALAGEVPGRHQFLTGTGTSDGQKVALDMNSRQQILMPGSDTAVVDIPAADTDLGAIHTLGAGSADQAPWRLTLTGAVLRTTRLAGCLEADDDGRVYFTDINTKRDRLLTGQVKVSGDSGAVTVGGAAGSGASASVVWGHGWARVTLNTGTGTVAGSLFTLTYPHAFEIQSSAHLQAANALASSYVGRQLYTNATTNYVEVATSASGAPTASSTYVIDVFFIGD